MKKMLKKINLMLIVLCSLFTMFVSGGVNVSALDKTKTFPITEYLKGTTNNLDTTNLDWFNGSYDDYETYLFDFNIEVNDYVKEIVNIKVRYQTCKFNVGGKCWVYSDYKTYTISSDYYYNSNSWDYSSSLGKGKNLGIIGAVGTTASYKEQAYKYFSYYANVEEYEDFESVIESGSTYVDEDTWTTYNLFRSSSATFDRDTATSSYTIKQMVTDLNNYDWYFIMPVEETIYNLVINAEVIDVNGEQWEMDINTEVNNQKSGNDIANFIEGFKSVIDKLVNFFKENTWALWILGILLIYPIIQIVISLVVTLFKLIMIPINIIIGIFSGINENSKKRRKKRKEKRLKEEEMYRYEENRRKNERYIENRQYDDKKLRKYRNYK